MRNSYRQIFCIIFKFLAHCDINCGTVAMLKRKIFKVFAQIMLTMWNIAGNSICSLSKLIWSSDWHLNWRPIWRLNYCNIKNLYWECRKTQAKSIILFCMHEKNYFPNSMEKWVSYLGYFSISFEKITFYTYWDFDLKSWIVYFFTRFTHENRIEINFSGQHFGIDNSYIIVLNILFYD